MATRIGFSTHYPDRMGELAGKPTRFPERIIKGLKYDAEHEWNILKLFYTLTDFDPDGYIYLHPKTTTIRSNYDYWKSKEGQLIQPFFWAGKPYKSKQVVFCPAVRLRRVSAAFIVNKRSITLGDRPGGVSRIFWTPEDFEYITQHEGFDHPDHFWMWFDQDFSGAYLELESVEG